MEQKKIEPIRDARKLGKAKMLILGIQHMFAMFGATILVPILVSGYFLRRWQYRYVRQCNQHPCPLLLQ